MDDIENFDFDDYFNGLTTYHNVWMDNLMKSVDEIIEMQKDIDNKVENVDNV